MNARTLLTIAIVPGALLLSGAGSATGAGPDHPHKLHGLTGAWSGFSQAIGNPDIRAADLFVRTQLDHRFEGNFALGPEPHVFPITGTTASCSNNLSPGEDVACTNNLFYGKSADSKVNAHTTLSDFGDGAAILDGRLKLQIREAASEEGSLLLLRNFIGNPDTAPPDLGGQYQGSASFGGEVVGIIIDYRPGRDERGAPTTAFEGTLILQPREGTGFPAFAALVLGSVNADGQIVAIGQGESGRLVFTADFMDPTNAKPPGRIIGELRLVLNDGSAREGTFEAVMVAPPEPD